MTLVQSSHSIITENARCLLMFSKLVTDTFFSENQAAWHICLETNCWAKEYSMVVWSVKCTCCTRGASMRVVSRQRPCASKQSPGRLGMLIYASCLTVLLQRYVITAHVGFSCRLQCKCRSWRNFTPSPPPLFYCIPLISSFKLLSLWSSPLSYILIFVCSV